MLLFHHTVFVSVIVPHAKKILVETSCAISLQCSDVPTPSNFSETTATVLLKSSLDCAKNPANYNIYYIVVLLMP